MLCRKALVQLLLSGDVYKRQESLSSTRIAAVEQALNDAVSGVGNCTGTVEISGMQDLTSQLSSGLSVKIYGPDADTITALGDKVVQMVNDIFLLKHFKLAIIDESSQILEPNLIGLLSAVDKFIDVYKRQL